MIIRSLQPADHPQAFSLWRSSTAIQLREEDGYEGFVAFLARNPGLSLAGLVEERLIATLLVGHDGRRGYLQHLFAVPEYRRQGRAQRLLEEASRRLARLGLRKSHVFVLGGSAEAVQFWHGQRRWVQREDIHVFSRSEQNDE